MPSAETLRLAFEALRNEAIEIRAEYNDFNTLFQSGPETHRLLDQLASAFFDRINAILIEHLYMRIARLTDAARTGSQPNLTVKHLNDLLCKAGVMTAAIEAHSEALHRYRDLLLPSRNKLIAHLDRDQVLSGGALGAHDEAEVGQFFENLQGYFDAAGDAVGVGRSDFMVLAHPGDAKDLVMKLRTLFQTSPGA